MKCNYVVGSDAKTHDIAVKANGLVNRALEAGDFVEAERLVDSFLSSPNRPFLMEFLHVVETQDVFAVVNRPPVLFPEPKTIMSLCDFTGAWSQPYVDAGYDVIRIDIKRGQDVRLVEHIGRDVHGILAAPPCTEFSGSGAQYWPAKDASGKTLEAIALVDACLRAVAIYRPQWWALENPVGRLRRWLGPPSLSFNPCDYGDPYTKKTLLWGQFAAPKKTPVQPERVCSQGSWLMKLGGKSERTKELRSVTPPGFSRAFFEANP